MISSVLMPATSCPEAVLRRRRASRCPLVSAPWARTIRSAPPISITSTSSPACSPYLARRCAGMVTWPLLFSLPIRWARSVIRPHLCHTAAFEPYQPHQLAGRSSIPVTADLSRNRDEVPVAEHGSDGEPQTRLGGPDLLDGSPYAIPARHLRMGVVNPALMHDLRGSRRVPAIPHAEVTRHDIPAGLHSDLPVIFS